MNVALNDYLVSACLLFVHDGQISCPKRVKSPASDYLYTIVHGVSRLKKGKRYNYYVVYKEIDDYSDEA